MNKYKKLITKQALFWLLVCALICAIYLLSGQEGAVSHRLSRGLVKKASRLIELPGVLKYYSKELNLSYDFVLRKIAHFSLFFILALLLFFVIKPLTTKHVRILTITCCIIFAFMDEYHQVFISGRTARFTDIMIDTAGAICGMLLVMIATGIRRGNIQKKKRTVGTKFLR